MKKLLPGVIMITFLLNSCSKADHKPTDDKAPHKITFNLSGFTQSLDAAKAKKNNGLVADATTLPIVKFLYYKAYKIEPAFGNNIPESMKKVSTLFQDSTSSSLGTFSDELPAGEYLFYFYGGATGSSLVGREAVKDSRYTFWPDAFAKRIRLTIGNGNVEQDVTLDRVVSQIKILFTDAIPANMKKLKIQVTSDYDYFELRGSNGDPEIDNEDFYSGDRNSVVRTKLYYISASAIGTTNYSQVFNLIDSFNSVKKIVITAFDASNHVIAQRVIANVSTAANTQTLLSGKLFGPADPFSIQLNQTWGTAINVGF